MAIDVKPKTEAPAFVTLELVAYKRYSRAGHLYTDESAYKFTPDQAEILLQEVDESSGRPIWRRYRPAAAQPVQMQVPVGTKATIDASADRVAKIDNEPQHPQSPRRLEVGDDSEIADILNQSEQVEI